MRANAQRVGITDQNARGYLYPRLGRHTEVEVWPPRLAKSCQHAGGAINCPSAGKGRAEDSCLLKQQASSRAV